MTELLILVIIVVLLGASTFTLLFLYLRIRYQKEDEREIIGTLWCIDQDPSEISISNLMRHTHKINIKKRRRET